MKSDAGQRMQKIIDLSRTIEDNMPVYPGDDKTRLFQTKYLSADQYNNFRLETGMHAGTHIDSPMHMTGNGGFISEMPLEMFAGKGCVLDVRNEPVIRMKDIYGSKIEENGIVLLYTGFDRFYGEDKYYAEHPVVDMDFCGFLIRKRIKMLGMDMPAPDRSPFIIHKALLSSRICILENLSGLDRLLNITSFEVMAFPLKIKSDGSMVRAIARIIE